MTQDLYVLHGNKSRQYGDEIIECLMKKKKKFKRTIVTGTEKNIF